jgi:ribosomal-protein-alanine N-acetyltransferase
MNLQAVKPADAADLAAVHAECFHEPWDASAIAEVMTSPGAFGFRIADAEDGAVLGFALGRAIVGEAELLTLAVAPAARRRGLAQALVAAVAAAAGDAGAAALFLEVADDNAPALALYRALGFEAVGRRPGYYRRMAAVADALVLRRALNSGWP